MQRSRNSKRTATIICAAVVLVLFLTILVFVLIPLVGEVREDRIAIGFAVLYGCVILAMVIGVIAALRQRLKEIERGEEEDAKKY